MKKLKVFTAVAIMALISSGTFNACKEDNILNAEKSSVHKMQKTSNFILMTEAEKTYLLKNGPSMTIENFF